MARLHAIAIATMALLPLAVNGFAVPKNQASLNRLVNQNMISQLTQELNPYGLALIKNSMGKLQAGNFLATQWNDANNNPGQGHSILQVTPNGQTSVFATIDPANATIQANCGNFGIGLTMALVILSKGYVIVGSTPIPVGGTVAGPGCLIVLDSNGNVLDTHAANEATTASGIMTGGGPWAAAVSETNKGSNANLYVSYVLGTNPNSTATLTGANGGMVVRYQLQVPGGGIKPSFWGASPEIIASGFPTQPGNIGGGAVGPTGLAFFKWGPTKDRLFIANNLNNSVVATPNPGGCFTRSGATPQCVTNPHVWGGLVQGPIGLAVTPELNVIGANGLIGTLFEFKVGAFQNLQLADQLVDNTPATVGAGTLFNVLFLNNNVLVFNDDGLNQFITLTPS